MEHLNNRHLNGKKIHVRIMSTHKLYAAYVLILSIVVFISFQYTSELIYIIMLNMLPYEPKQSIKTTTYQSVAAFYTCHDQVAATNKVLAYFRQQFPHAPIYLFNDAGNPFMRHLAKIYGAVYTYHPIHAVSVSRGNFWNSADRAWVYIEDLLATAVRSNTDWILLLEDDVLTLGQFDLNDIQFDMNGANPDKYYLFVENQFWYRTVQQYIKEQHPTYTLHYSYNGCGGTIFRGSFLRKLAENTTLVREQVNALARLAFEVEKLSSLASDQLLTFIIQINGGSVGTNQHYIEPWWTNSIPSYLSGHAHVLHGDKSTYV